MDRRPSQPVDLMQALIDSIEQARAARLARQGDATKEESQDA